MVGQGAIIAAGAIAYPPGFAHAPRSTLEQLGVEKVMTMTSTYDHRVIQGAQSGEYLRRVDELLGGADEFYETRLRADGRERRRARRRDERQRRARRPCASATSRSSADIAGMPSEEMLRAIAAGMAIVSAYRRHGHLGARSTRSAANPPAIRRSTRRRTTSRRR